MEPITIFARAADPAVVASRLRELCPHIAFDGPDDDWSEAVAAFDAGKKQRTLTFTHDPAYYAEPGWSTQMNGMRGYFSRFPPTANQEKVLLLTTTFRFSLGTLFEPDFDTEGDPRLDLLFDLTQWLDGVLFTPSTLRDARGRILYGAGGEDKEDADAKWPRVHGEVSMAEGLGAAMHEHSRPRKDDDEPAEAEPPLPERVARRALALTAVTARAILEQDKNNPIAAATYQNLLAWLEDIEIGSELEPEEWEVVQRPLGRLESQLQVNSTWRLEGLVILAWALGRFEIPPHDRLVELNPLWHSLGLLDGEGSRALLASPTLRTRQELNELRNRLFALHWRLRDFHINRKLMNFVEFARTAWFGPLDVSDIPIVDGDLAIGGQRLDRASPDAFSTAHSAAQERHQAANWLREGPTLYSCASVAT